MPQNEKMRYQKAMKITPVICSQHAQTLVLYMRVKRRINNLRYSSTGCIQKKKLIKKEKDGERE